MFVGKIQRKPMIHIMCDDGVMGDFCADRFELNEFDRES